MFLSGATRVGQSATWPTTVDLLGPAAPAVDNVGAGGGLLKLNWLPNTDPDVLGYRLFCENLGMAGGGFTVYDADSPRPETSAPTTCPDAGTGTGTTDNAAGDASDDAGGGGSDDAGASATDAGCTPGTGGPTGGTSSCGSELVEGKTLTPGQIAQYSCGNTAGLTATSGLVTGLNNFERYAVGVAAFDLVENVGVLSSVRCATPQPVNGFDEAYRSAGGSAGGASFCSLGLRSAAARASVWPAGVFVAFAVLAQRRRRSRASLRRPNRNSDLHGS
jgi:hypothetical protein